MNRCLSEANRLFSRRGLRTTRLLALMTSIATAGVGSLLPAAELPGGIRVQGTFEPPRALPGETVTLAVTVVLPSDWVIHDIEQVPNSVMPTRIDIDPSPALVATAAFSAKGARENLDPRFAGRPVRYFSRSPTFRRPVRVASDALPGTLALSGTISFLAEQRSTGKFAVVSRAPFQANLSVVTTLEPAPLIAASATEIELPAATSTARPPAPSFHIKLDLPPAEMETAAPPSRWSILAMAAGFGIAIWFGWRRLRGIDIIGR